MAVARVTEIISASPKSFDDAIEKGIKRADKTLKNLKGAWVKSQKVVIEKGKVVEYRVNLKVTFVLIEEPFLALRERWDARHRPVRAVAGLRRVS